MANPKIRAGEVYISKDKHSIFSVSEIIGSCSNDPVYGYEIALKGFTCVTFEYKDYYYKDLSRRTDKTENSLYLKVMHMIKSARKEILDTLKNATLYDFDDVEIGKCYIRTIDKKSICFIKDHNNMCEYDLLQVESLSQKSGYYWDNDSIKNTCKLADISVYQQITSICDNLLSQIDIIFETCPILSDEA